MPLIGISCEQAAKCSALQKIGCRPPLIWKLPVTVINESECAGIVMNVFAVVIIGIAIWWGVLFVASLCSPDIGPDLHRLTNKLRLLTSIQPLNSAAALLCVVLFLPLYLSTYPLAVVVILLLWGAFVL